jgi:hypothetical protein
MLRFLKRLFALAPNTSKPFRSNIAFWSKEELTDLSPRLAQAFGIESLARDYENAWEWLEATSPDGLHVNISRTHDWKTGDYHLPVIVRLSRHGYISQEEVERWARTLAEKLDVDVSVGIVTEEDSKSSEYGFRRDHEFLKQKKG